MRAWLHSLGLAALCFQAAGVWRRRRWSAGCALRRARASSCWHVLACLLALLPHVQATSTHVLVPCTCLQDPRIQLLLYDGILDLSAPEQPPSSKASLELYKTIKYLLADDAANYRCELAKGAAPYGFAHPCVV